MSTKRACQVEQRIGGVKLPELAGETPALHVDFMDRRELYALGLDVGGTKMAAGLVNFPTGRLISRLQAPTAPERGGKAVLRDLLSLVKRALAPAQGEGLSLSAIGLGICELVDREGEIVSGNSLAWSRRDL